MFVESFHRTLKRSTWSVSTTEVLITCYLLYAKSPVIRHMNSGLRQRREKSPFVSGKRPRDTSRQSRQDAESCQVQSLNDKTKIYHVRRVDSSICKCLLRCSFCAACVHSFQCTCLDCAITGVVCVHIHAVNIAEPVEDPRDVSSNETNDKREEMRNFIQVDKAIRNDKELEDLNRSALVAIAELTDVMQTAPSKDTVYTALRHIHSATTVAKGLAIIGNDHHYLKTKSFPPNKKAEKQRRFFSTKRKARVVRKKALLSETSAKELQEIEPDVCAFCLKEDPPYTEKEFVDRVECGSCQVWVHTLCDSVQDKSSYICFMCRP